MLTSTALMQLTLPTCLLMTSNYHAQSMSGT